MENIPKNSRRHDGQSQMQPSRKHTLCLRGSVKEDQGCRSGDVNNLELSSRQDVSLNLDDVDEHIGQSAKAQQQEQPRRPSLFSELSRKPVYQSPHDYLF